MILIKEQSTQLFTVPQHIGRQQVKQLGVGCPQISLRSETEAKHSETFFREIAKLTPQFRLFRFKAKKEF